MAICTMLVVIPFWCNEPDAPEPEEPVAEEMVVEAQPAPEVEATAIGSGSTLRPVSELEVRPPASAGMARPATPTPAPQPAAPSDDSARPDPRLYGQAAGPDWTPPASTATAAPDMPRAEPTTAAVAPPPRAEPDPGALRTERVAMAEPNEPTPAPVPGPSTYSEPTPEPDTTEVAVYRPGREPARPSAPEPQSRPAAPRPAAVTTPAAVPEPPVNPDTGLTRVAARIDAGAMAYAEAEPFESAADRYEAEGIAQRKERRYRRAMREQERAERRARRQAGE